MVDRITEVLEDGTVHCFDMDKCADEAEKILLDLHAKDGVEIDFDYTATVYSLFIQSIHILSVSGWSTMDLIDEVVENSDAGDIVIIDDTDDDS